MIERRRSMSELKDRFFNRKRVDEASKITAPVDLSPSEMSSIRNHKP